MTMSGLPKLTGGGTASCLQTIEAGGMGEGWSDAMADWLENDSKISDYVLGACRAFSIGTGHSLGSQEHT